MCILTLKDKYTARKKKFCDIYRPDATELTSSKLVWYILITGTERLMSECQLIFAML